MTKIKERLKPTGKLIWSSTYGTYLSGQAAIDGADHVALVLEQKWGAGRLRLLVPLDLRQRFDRQRFKFHAAIRHGELQEVLGQALRMTTAWMALDRAAEAAGASKLVPCVWEAAMADGTVLALVRHPEDARAVAREGRKVVVYTVAEITLMLANYREVTRAKEIIPGASVEAVRRIIPDPLDAIRDGEDLEERFDDGIPDLAL